MTKSTVDNMNSGQKAPWAVCIVKKREKENRTVDEDTIYRNNSGQ